MASGTYNDSSRSSLGPACPLARVPYVDPGLESILLHESTFRISPTLKHRQGMHSQLDTYRSDFLALKEEAPSLIDETKDDLLRTPPGPETWSVAQVFDHLNTAGWLLLNFMEQAIQKGQEEGPYGTPPFEYGFISRWFIRSMRPSSSWTFTTPSVFEPEPPETLYPHETIKDFRALQDQFAACVTRAEGLDLRRLRVASPALPLLYISLGAWFEATIAHQERHLEQARSILGRLEGA